MYIDQENPKFHMQIESRSKLVSNIEWQFSITFDPRPQIASHFWNDKDKTHVDTRETRKWTVEQIRSEVGLICLAGGQGTRLGVPYPKASMVKKSLKKAEKEIQITKFT